MRVLRALDLKVLRDVQRLWAQLLAIALVMGCGLGVFLGMRSTMRSLEAARDSYYATERFAHVFAQLERAPERIAARIAELPEVQRVETRVVAPVTLEVPGLVEPAVGVLVSLPEDGPPALNALRLRSGRMPQSSAPSEVVVNEAFSEANRLLPGDSLSAIVHGHYEELKVVGTALSPEYTYALAPGRLFPDDRLFGVLWMRRRSLAPAVELEGAFNEVSLLLEHGAEPAAVIERIDPLLAPYGGIGAIARKDQQSAFFVENELRQLDTFAWMVPLLFLAVAAFLLNVVVGRIIAGQRPELAAMKAFGYRDREVGLHYGKLVGLVVLLGCLFGVALGGWIGVNLVRLYGEYYRFPEFPYTLGASEVVLGVFVCVASASFGTWSSIRKTVILPPAEAMRPEAPPVYRRTLVERLRLTRLIPPAARIVLRELERQPRRAGLTMVGIAMATGLTVANAFTLDSVRYILDVQFGIGQREDVHVSLLGPRAMGALSSLRALPGVELVEPSRVIPVRFHVGRTTKSSAITALSKESRLTTLLDTELRTVTVPSEGLLLSRKLAEVLGVAPGQVVDVEVLEGRRRRLELNVASVVDTFVGAAAYMNLSGVPALLGETQSLNAAQMLVDEGRLDELYGEVKETPGVIGVTTRASLLRKVREQLDQNLGVFISISVSFSLVLAFGVLYNAARITLAERARELASLRVLGFARREVAAILLGELGLLTVVSIPLGLLLGRFMAAMLVRSPGYDTEQFRLPLVISPATYALAAGCVVLAAALSGWDAWRKLDRFDIVEVLKTRD
jgi:putative ABC transport system permease protein